jgi:glycosyltransferase involved in cell wall biosynthesis
MRILFISNLYPPVAVGGYEVECSSVVEHLAHQHDVCVLTSGRAQASAVTHPDASQQVEVRRERTLRAPLASLRAVDTARKALEWKPDLIYAWNGAAIPQSALRVLADSGAPLAFRVCEHWFGDIFLRDQFLRELLPGSRGPVDASWAAGCRVLNLLPALRLDPTAPIQTAVSWNSEAIRRMVTLPPFVETALERVCHSVPRYGDLYAEIDRKLTDEPEIVFVGRITPFKGGAVAIEALALLRSDHDVVATLVLAGPEDASHAEELRALAARLGVADSLRWEGALPPKGIAALLARASAMIVPSTWDEPFPLVTIEGALARVPLVASDVGGIGEGMHDEEHALLFPRGEGAAAAAALARTLRETEQTAARVQRAHERAQAFRLGPYLAEQERFVHDALNALRANGDSAHSRRTILRQRTFDQPNMLSLRLSSPLWASGISPVSIRTISRGNSR